MAIDGIIAAGSTEVITRVFLFKDSGATAGTEGDPLTGLTNSSSGLIIASMRSDEATVTTYTQAASGIETITTIGTHADPSASNVRFREIDATNMPGYYEIQWLDARWATGAVEHSVMIHGAADLAPVRFKYILDTITLADINSELSSYGVPTTTDLTNRTLAAADYATDTQQQTILDELAGFTDGTNMPQVDLRAVEGEELGRNGVGGQKYGGA